MYYLGGWRAGSVFKSTILADNLGSDISNHTWRPQVDNSLQLLFEETSHLHGCYTHTRCTCLYLLRQAHRHI